MVIHITCVGGNEGPLTNDVLLQSFRPNTREKPQRIGRSNPELEVTSEVEVKRVESKREKSPNPSLNGKDTAIDRVIFGFICLFMSTKMGRVTWQVALI